MIDKTRQAIAAAAEHWADVRHLLAGLESMPQWVDDFANRVSYGAPSPRLLNGIGTIDTILVDLRADALGESLG